MNALPSPPPVAGRIIDAELDLLDRQVMDSDGVPVTAVDDIEFSTPPDLSDLDPDDPPCLTGLLNGPVLGTRVFGGRPPNSRYIRTPWSVVADVDIVITLGVRAESLDAGWVERWLRDHVIGRIPGGRHDPD